MIIPDSSHFMLFISASLILLIVPGPAVLYIIGRSIDQGLKAGLVSVVGIGIGSLVHVAAASIGVSAILVASATAFMILKYAGALYLIYLGLSTLLRKQKINTQTRTPNHSLRKIFTQGVIVNVFNPKAALFFFAFLPQFVSPLEGTVTAQIIFLGFIFTILAIATDSTYALLSSRLSTVLKSSSLFLRIQKYLVGSIYILLGLLTLTVNQYPKR